MRASDRQGEGRTLPATDGSTGVETAMERLLLVAIAQDPTAHLAGSDAHAEPFG
jgi:hypothetical protein